MNMDSQPGWQQAPWYGFKAHPGLKMVAAATPRPELDWARFPPLGPIIAADDAGNALPSLHAAFALFSAIWMDRLLRRALAPAWLRIASAVWGLGILYSTLATRQHVAVDAIAGTAPGWLAAVLHLRWLRLRPPYDALAMRL
ncbi:MAG: phosphatase PAP2 family protein [Pseudomonadota bacterium]